MERGLIDFVISTGANLYHDLHYALNFTLRRGSPFVDDRVLYNEGVIRIYDVLFPAQVLLDTDTFIRDFLVSSGMEGPVSTAELHEALGRHLLKVRPGCAKYSVVASAAKCGVPIYTSSPGDSSIGMNVAALSLDGNLCVIDPNADVNETASIVLAAKRGGGRSAVFICGGGSPKNFMLQTEPQIQEVLGIDEKGHDYFLQITDARPDTGGLSGATPAEAVSWGKIDPDRLPDAVVCYLDSTVALPLLTAYAHARHAPRPLRRLLDRREANMRVLRDEFARANGAPAEPSETDAKLPMHR
jgi:deoxyhypusine synthase